MQANQSRRLYGFTLVEILITLSIVFLLCAILIPVQSSIRLAAKRSHCASNLRQIGIGLKLYANEHAGAFPQSTHSLGTFGKHRSWIFQLENYIGDVDEIRICPFESAERAKQIRQLGATSYTMNDLVVDSPAYNNHMWIPQPSRTLLMFIVAEHLTPSLTRDHIHGGEWDNWTAVLNDIEPDRHRLGDRDAKRLSGSSTYLYVDGHVEVIAASDFKRILDEGTNPAIPPG